MVKKGSESINFMIKHAIVGCGHIAPSHVDACDHNGVEIVACLDLDKKKAEAFSQKYGIDRVLNSLEELLEDESINTVSVCTDHKSHSELALKLLDAGKNVIVEKPMSLKVQDAKRMIEVAKKKRKVLSVISQHRYNPVIVAIKKSLDNHDFGKITMVNATLNCQKDSSYYTDSYWKGTLDLEGGSTLINQAIHTLDLVLWMKNDVPKKVKSLSSVTKFAKVIETEDSLGSVMKFSDESMLVFSSTNTSVDIWDSKIEFIGTKGSVTFSADYPVKILHLVHEDSKKALFLKKHFVSFEDKFEKAPPVSYYGTKHRDQMADFFNVVSGRASTLFMPPSEALNTLDVVFRIYKDARQK